MHMQIKALRQRILDNKGVKIRDGSIIWALRSPVSAGDDDVAYRFLLALSDSSEGLIANYDSAIKLRGSVNRQGVTCYLDSTLFSMFSRLDSFEAMLYNTFPDRPRSKLSFLLRLWVNMLRTGQLVTTDITALIQESIKECGWEEAAELQQHDASEAFTFITGKLELPLLTLKMDIYHTGKEDASDDHKFINERLLDVAIPEDPSGQRKEITLEDCLEEYFNNRVEVKRYLERRATTNSIKAGTDPKTKLSGVHVEIAEVEEDGLSTTLSPNSPTRPPIRHRSQSIIQERYIPARGESGYSANLANVDTQNSSRSRAGSVRKEVLMPAWQFFSLIPWYTDNAPSNDAQVAAHFSSKRPVLGLCLKRYAFKHGRSVRLNTYVDIPIEIGLPHFIQDDNMTDQAGPLTGNFKLSLQAVVCHRGNSVESGHYVALTRGKPISMGQSGLSNIDYWMRFDDLASERITRVDIHKALREETPYLLFYQIVPVEGDPGNLTAGEEGSVSRTSLPLSRVTTASHPSPVQPAVDVTAATPVEDSRGREPPADSRRASVVSFSDNTKLAAKSDSSNASPASGSRKGSTDLGKVSSRTSDGGFGRTLSKLRRKSRDPVLPSDEQRPDVNVTEVPRSGSFASDAAAAQAFGVQAPGAKSGGLSGQSAYQESRAMYAPGHDGHKRNKSKNRLEKKQKGKDKHGHDKHPDRECSVM